MSESSRPQFTAKVTSGGMLNIPQNVQDLNNIEKDDLVEVEILRHRKDGQEVEVMETAENE